MKTRWMPLFTLFFALVFLVLGLIKPVYAQLITINTNDNAIDPGWSVTPGATDPALDHTAPPLPPAQNPIDIINIWAAPDASNWYFRIEVNHTSPVPYNTQRRLGVFFDCDDDGNTREGGTDWLVTYFPNGDIVEIRNAGTLGSPTTVGTAASGEQIASGPNLEWSVSKATLAGAPFNCGNAQSGIVRLEFAGIQGGGVHDDILTILRFNSPTAVSLQSLTASPAGTWLSVISLTLAGLLLVATLVLRRRKHQPG